ncbi:MAG: hypothetical protein P1V97_29840, partial [Planctomycetota bacterium]|nr:hypothetical protein [Planctomycetota bacterium]
GSRSQSPKKSRRISMINAELDDQKDILAFSRDGSQDAFTSFVDRHHKHLFQLCFFILDDSGLAHQAVKKVFVAVLRDSYRYTQKTPFQPWFNAIINRVLHSQLGKALHRQRHENGPLKANKGLLLSLPGAAAHAFGLHTLFGRDPMRLAKGFACPPGQMRSQLNASFQEVAERLSKRLNLTEESAEAEQAALAAIEELKNKTRVADMPKAPSFQKLERDAARQTTSILLAKARFPQS